MGEEKVLDLVQEHWHEYEVRKRPFLLLVLRGNYLALPGQGDPREPVFQAKAEALNELVQTIRTVRQFHITPPVDFKVCPIECLWYGPEGECDFSSLPRETWCWTLLVRIPDFLHEKDLNEAVVRQLEKGNGPLVHDVTIRTLEEGHCVQALHTGPAEARVKTLDRMNIHAQDRGLVPHKWLHEIYLSNRHVAPDRMRTLLRQPVHEPG